MKPVLSLALFAGLVAAQAEGVPNCAKPCITKYTSGDNIAGCKSLDVACICSNDQFLEGIACCLEDACDQAGKDEAVKYAKQICTGQGIQVPDEVVCRSAASTSGTSSATGTPTPASGSNAPSTSTESTSTETESPGAASGLQVTGGLFGAVVAMLMAL